MILLTCSHHDIADLFSPWYCWLVLTMILLTCSHHDIADRFARLEFNKKITHSQYCTCMSVQILQVLFMVNPSKIVNNLIWWSEPCSGETACYFYKPQGSNRDQIINCNTVTKTNLRYCNTENITIEIQQVHTFVLNLNIKIYQSCCIDWTNFSYL
jgi:hypothetical protein